jgi:DNA-binding transcriptional ArsR family regulator
MVNLSSEEADLVFRALSDGTRREMLAALGGGEVSISELALPFDMSLAGVSKHVKVLERAGLVDVRKEGRTHYCRFNRRALRPATDIIRYYERFWNTRLDALQAHLEGQRRR